MARVPYLGFEVVFVVVMRDINEPGETLRTVSLENTLPVRGSADQISLCSVTRHHVFHSVRADWNYAVTAFAAESVDDLRGRVTVRKSALGDNQPLSGPSLVRLQGCLVPGR